MQEHTGLAPVVLLLEDDDAVRTTLHKSIVRKESRADIVSVASAAAAREALLQRLSWACLVLDYTLPDGNGLDVLAEARTRNVEAPALLITGTTSPLLINRAASLRATYVCKPDISIVGTFVARSLAEFDDASARIDRAVAEVAERFELTAAEAVLLTFALRGLSRDEFTEKRGISENTYKTQARSLLAKTHQSTISALCNEVLRGLLKR